LHRQRGCQCISTSFLLQVTWLISVTRTLYHILGGCQGVIATIFEG